MDGSPAPAVREAFAGPSGPALRRGALGSALVALGGWSAGSLPVDGGPAAHLGARWALTGHGTILGLVVLWSGVALLVTAWLALGPRAVVGRLPSHDALVAVGAWSLPLLPSVPVFSTDAWTYLSQGALAAAGLSPYAHGAESSPGVFTSEVHPDWRSTTSPYGPVHVLLMRGIVTVVGPHPLAGVLVLRLIALAAVAALCLALLALARRTGTEAGTGLWFGAASPLVVLHFVGGLHNEVLALAPCVAALAAALGGRRLAAGLLVGLAMSVKITAVIVAPFLLWSLLSSRARRTTATTAADLACVSALPLGVLGLAAVIGPGWGWIDALAVSDRVVNYLSLPTGVAHVVSALGGPDRFGFDRVLAHARTGGAVVLAGVLVVAWLTHRRPVRRVFRGLVVALVGFVTLNTVSWPWYHPWIGAVWTPAGLGRGLTATAVTVAVFLSLVVGPNGSTSLYSPALVAAAALSAVGAAVWWARATRREDARPVRTPSPEPAA